ncbi:NADP-dependent malic enzyme, chloroplastic, partial [Glycine soja]
FVCVMNGTFVSGYTLLRDHTTTKDSPSLKKERDAHYLRGLLPPTNFLFFLIKDLIVNFIIYFFILLQERNERLFYKLLLDHAEELLPVVYTPTAGEACQKYGSIFVHPQDLYLSLNEKGRILEVLRNWPEMNIQVIVVTDGERILGLGDLAPNILHKVAPMWLPLLITIVLYIIKLLQCLLITIDVGTNNEKLLNDELYFGLRHKRATGQEYAELLHEFMNAVKQNYGERILVQFEDFANHNAFDLLERYRSTHLVFNDDIQAGTGIAELIALETSKRTNVPLDEVRKNIWLVDSKGLIVSSRKESLQHFKKPWAHEHEPVKELVNVVKQIKPTVLIGTSGQGRTFTKDVVEAMASINEVIRQSTISYLLCILMSTEANLSIICINAYIFPGFGLGLIMSGTIRVHDDLLLAASEALASQVTQEDYDKGLIYPPFSNIRKKISAHIAANVAAKAYELGLATRLPQPKDLVKFAESSVYSPVYRGYR